MRPLVNYKRPLRNVTFVSAKVIDHIRVEYVCDATLGCCPDVQRADPSCRCMQHKQTRFCAIGKRHSSGQNRVPVAPR